MTRQGVSFLFLTFIISFFIPFSTSHAFDDQGEIQINGSVGVTSSDMQLEIASSTSSQVGADEEITYTITYGSTSSLSFPVTLVASWEQGQIEGTSSPSVELLDYMEGSATVGYGSTSPVIDVVAKKITWSITSFPAATTNQTVTFVLKTSSDYRGSKTVSTNVVAMMTSPSGVPDSTVTTTYRYVDTSSEDATPTPSPSPTSTVATETQSVPVWKEIELVELGYTLATFRLSLDSDVQIVAFLGTTSTNLRERVTTAARARLQPLTLSELSPDTTYYVQFKAVGSTGLFVTSNIYTFTTSSQANADLIVDRNSIIVSQSWGILFNQSMLQDPLALPHFSVSQDTLLDFLFRIPLSRELVEATLLLRDPYVLGISTDEEGEYSSSTTKLVEVSPGTFVGKIKTPLLSRTYEIAIRTEDIYGNIQEQTVGKTTVVHSFQVKDPQGQSLWGAEVLLWSYQQKTNQFELAPFNALSFQNPISTNKDGVAEFSLIPGRYKARVSMKGYGTKEVEFELYAPQLADLPVVTLEPVRFGMIGRFLTGVELARQNLRLTVRALPQANPTGSLYDILFPFNLLFLLLLLTAASLKLHIIRFPLRTFFSKFRATDGQSFQVSLEDFENLSPVSNAVIYMVDEEKHLIIARGKTALDGSVAFAVSLVPNRCTFFVKRHGYAVTSHPVFSRTELQSSTNIVLSVEQLPATSIRELFKQEFQSMLREFIGFGSEAFLTLSLLCTLLFTMTQTPTRTIVFGALTVLNVCLWLIAARHSYGSPRKRS
ncbi:hypothetical protein KBD71_01525 [Candidatus Woesebacteria bacterium]|nr:hypothetical protein [Candidatus Woesebacteria bacterium]